MAALLTKSCDLIAWAAKVFIGALVGAIVLYRERLHVAIDMFMAPLPRAARRAVGWAIELLILAFNFVLLLYGLKLRSILWAKPSVRSTSPRRASTSLHPSQPA